MAALRNTATNLARLHGHDNITAAQRAAARHPPLSPTPSTQHGHQIGAQVRPGIHDFDAALVTWRTGYRRTSLRKRLCGLHNLLGTWQAQVVPLSPRAISDNEVFSPGFAVHGPVAEASLHVSAVSWRNAECAWREPLPRSRASSP